jgi:phosphatidate cytidylyltransferase
MAFNVQTFRTRTLSAIVFIIIMLAGLFINKWTFFLLFSIIHFGCWIEYQKLVGLIDKEYQQVTPFHKYGVRIAGWCIMLWFSNGYNIFELQLHELGWWMGLIFVFILPINELLFAKTIRLKNIGHSIFGLIYISLSLGLMMDLYKTFDIHLHDTLFVVGAAVIPIVIIASLWINDTMAYIVGSFIGKTSLSPISPKKTWEGTVGGFILSIVITGLATYYIGFHILSIAILAIIIAAIAAVAGTFGDLLESKLKRMAGVKDTGSLMPGHGGFLDRFDSLLLAIPFVWLFVYFFMK